MKWLTNYKHPKGLNFIIDEDLPAGFYTYMYTSPETYKKDLPPSPRCTHHRDEDLQDTLEIAKERAHEMYGVPVDSWKQVE